MFEKLVHSSMVGKIGILSHSIKRKSDADSKVMFEKLVHSSMVGTRNQTKLSVTYTEGDFQGLSIQARWDVLGEGYFCSKFKPVSLFNCQLTEVFAYFFVACSRPPKAPQLLGPTPIVDDRLPPVHATQSQVLILRLKRR